MATFTLKNKLEFLLSNIDWNLNVIDGLGGYFRTLQHENLFFVLKDELGQGFHLFRLTTIAAGKSHLEVLQQVVGALLQNISAYQCKTFYFEDGERHFIEFYLTPQVGPASPAPTLPTQDPSNESSGAGCFSCLTICRRAKD